MECHQSYNEKKRYDLIDRTCWFSFFLLFLASIFISSPLFIQAHYELDSSKSADDNEMLERKHFKISTTLYILHIIGLALLTCATCLLLLVIVVMCRKGDLSCLGAEIDENEGTATKSAAIDGLMGAGKNGEGNEALKKENYKKIFSKSETDAALKNEALVMDVAGIRCVSGLERKESSLLVGGNDVQGSYGACVKNE